MRAGTKNSSRRGDRGATQIEFVVSILIILFTIFAVFEFCMVVHAMNVLADAAREGVRYAIVHGVNNSNCSGPNPGTNCATPDVAADNVKTVVRGYAKLTLKNISAINIAVNYPDGNNAPRSRVTVAITYNYLPYVHLPGLTPVLKAHAQGRIVN